MEQKILERVLRHPGVPDDRGLISDMITDCIAEIRSVINYQEDEDIPASLHGVVTELVLEKINKDGVQGIQSESQPSGGSTTYLEDMPKNIKRQIYRERRMVRRRKKCLSTEI